MKHELKIAPKWYEQIVKGIKTFEVRKDDRGYSTGDILILREYIDGDYTGNNVTVKVLSVLRDEFYCKEGFCIMSIRKEETDG